MTQSEKNKNISDELIKKNRPFILVSDIKNRATKAQFKCLKCGKIFSSTPHNILINNKGCPSCGKKHRWEYDEVLNAINSTDNGAYLLKNSKEYICNNIGKVDTNKIVTIYHSKCKKEFKIRLTHFIKSKRRCPFCYSKNHKLTTAEFMEKINNIYGDRFSIKEGTKYNGRRKKVTLHCNICGHDTTDIGLNFLTNHRGCSYCNASAAEQVVLSTFNSSNLKYQVKIKHSKTNALSFDFLMNNIYLECDGIQHFRAVSAFGGAECFEKQITRDSKKNMYIYDNNLKLIRIYSGEIVKKSVVNIFNSSTTIADLDKSFKNILVIDKHKILLCKGYYKDMLVHLNLDGNKTEKDIV